MAARVPLTKEFFEHKKGIPKTTRKQWETDRTAQITFNTADLTVYIEALIMGQTVYNQMGSLAASAEHVASLLTDGTRRRKYVKMAKKVNPAFKQYDLIACASNTTASLKESYNIAVVESLTASLITLADAGLPVDPVVGDLVGKIRFTEFIDSMGTDTTRSAILFWDTVTVSDVVKIQHALFFPELRNYTGGDLDFKDGAEPYDTGITLSAQAVSMTYSDGTTGYNFYKKWAFNFRSG